MFRMQTSLLRAGLAVLLGLLLVPLAGSSRATAAGLPTDPVPDPHQAGVLYFAPTGHTLRGDFRLYWHAHGGLFVNGYPISEGFQEKNPIDGKTYTVQYFQRERFEYHPENAGTPYEVELGLLGTQLARKLGYFGNPG